jgi:hypothetical protein
LKVLFFKTVFFPPGFYLGQHALRKLDLRGFKWVKLFVSGGITEDDIPVLNEVVDGYGIGTSLSNSPVIDFALDIVEIEGKPIAKRGKESGRKNLLDCKRCGSRIVVPFGTNQARCRCGEKMNNLLTTAIKGGNIISKKRTPQEIREMFEAVLGAQSLAMTLVRPGATGAEVHGKVVDYFRERGYETDTRDSIHNLGHGVGLEVHELPVIGPAGGELAVGNVITLEPGLYLPGIGGVRLEDIVVVRDDGCQVLTKAPKELTWAE